MYTIKHVVLIRAPRAQVYSALTTKRGLAGWWTSDVQTTDQTRKDSIIHFKFGGNFACDMRVETIEQDKLVRWIGLALPPAWTNSVFSFALVDDPIGTKLRFSQVYAENAPLSEDDHGLFTYNWGWYLRSLKDLCEKGAGSPFGSTGNPQGTV